VEAAKDVVFPTRALKRELEDAHERLRQVEDELRSIKETEGDRKRQKLEEVTILNWGQPLF
jgi:predicted  nucleic acid-binding Zn-ribbon protein